MPRPSKQLITITVIIIVVAIVLLLKCVVFSTSTDTTVKDFRSKGNPDAPVQIIEYLDFQCPSCAYASVLTNQLMGQYPGQIHITLKHFPLSGHRHGLTAATYVECGARQNKFWEFHDKVFASQNQWKGLNDAKPAFELIADELQLNKGKLQKCLSDPSITKMIDQHKNEGKEQGVRSTPTLFINGEIFVGTGKFPKKLQEMLTQNQSIEVK